MHKCLKSKCADWSLRIAFAAPFLYHGITKFPMMDMVAEMTGYSAGVMTVVAITEILAAVLILADGFMHKGMLSKIGGIMGAIIMLGAMKLAFPNGFNFMAGGYEFQLVLFLLSLHFALSGCAKNDMNKMRAEGGCCGGDCHGSDK